MQKHVKQAWLMANPRLKGCPEEGNTARFLFRNINITPLYKRAEKLMNMEGHMIMMQETAATTAASRVRE